MNTSRRSFFALFAGLGSAVAASRVAAPATHSGNISFSGPITIEMTGYSKPGLLDKIVDPTHNHSIGKWSR